MANYDVGNLNRLCHLWLCGSDWAELGIPFLASGFIAAPAQVPARFCNVVQLRTGLVAAPILSAEHMSREHPHALQGPFCRAVRHGPGRARR